MTTKMIVVSAQKDESVPAVCAFPFMVALKTYVEMVSKPDGFN